MKIDIREVKTKKDLKNFIYLPAKIHKNHTNWVPPIYMDDFTFFDPKKNKSFDSCDTILALAYKGEEIVGRIMGIIPHKYNALHNENDGRFCFMETYEDPEVFHALITFIEDWARGKGKDRIVGPLGFSDKDPQGFMIEGFDGPIIFATNGNFPYMPKLLEAEGYSKKIDCVEYKVKIPDQIPDFYMNIYNRVLERKDIHLMEFTSKRQIKPYIKPILTLLNETFADIYAFVPFEEYEMVDFANRYLPILDLKFVKAVANDKGEIISFIIALPDIGEGIIAAKGKVLPFGYFKIISARNKAKQLDLLLGGIKKEYRGKGLDTLMGINMMKTAQERGIEYIDSHVILETNNRMRMEIEKMGGNLYRRFRIFQKPL
jgi:predicted GNAT family acetyltransferase